MPLTLRPSITLGIQGDPYTLFYDYDQVEKGKLSLLSLAEKVIWFRERLHMTHVEPLKRIWNDDVVFEKLLHSKLDPNARCSFAIAAMALMLSVVETLGTFRSQKLKGKDKNRRAFFEFLSNHMNQGNVKESNTMKSVAEVLWQSFRNGITHDLRVDRVSGVDQLWGSLEFQENFANTANARFEKHGQLLRICPRAFFEDLEAGVKEYFGKLEEGNELLLNNFQSRFDEVYPNRPVRT